MGVMDNFNEYQTKYLGRLNVLSNRHSENRLLIPQILKKSKIDMDTCRIVSATYRKLTEESLFQLNSANNIQFEASDKQINKKPFQKVVSTLEKTLSELLSEVTQLVETDMLPRSEGEQTVYLHTLIADIYRKITPTDQSVILDTYHKGYELAYSSLSILNETYLTLVNNYVKYLYSLKDHKQKARNIVSQTYSKLERADQIPSELNPVVKTLRQNLKLMLNK